MLKYYLNPSPPGPVALGEDVVSQVLYLLHKGSKDCVYGEFKFVKSILPFEALNR